MAHLMVNLNHQTPKKSIIQLFKSCGFWLSFLLFIGAEVSLLKLAAWQHDRMGQRAAERAAAQNVEPITLSGTFDITTKTYLLEHQQHKINAGIQTGWRVFSKLNLDAGGSRWVDRGWTPYPQGSARLQPDINAYAPPAGHITLSGQYLPFPQRKKDGWGGATTTTHPQVLAFLDYAYINPEEPSHKIPPYFQSLTETTTTNKIIPSAAPLPSPARHQEYMLTWLALALILPMLYSGLLFQKFKK